MVVRSNCAKNEFKLLFGNGLGSCPTADKASTVEALDGGNPVAKAPHRDRLMRLEAPFTGEPEEVFKAEHRIVGWQSGWGADGGTLMLTQRERMRRWRYTWLLDVDQGTSRMWFDLNESDRYKSPGYPERRQLPSGEWVLHQSGDAVYFSGSGGTEKGDRPFLDLRSMKTGEVERLFRCKPDRYEYFVAFAGNEDRFMLHSESPVDVPNYYLSTLGDTVEATEGEATRAYTKKPITSFEDPTPQLRQIKKRLVRYERDDGMPLSFELQLPPGYQEGTRLPTVLYAYPQEYSDPSTAGQVRGSAHRFSRIYGASHLFFLLQGYAVLNNTAMPMIGDPETTYDTFVPQLVADAEAAVANVFAVRDGCLLTPPGSDGALEGINRATVLELAGPLGIPAREATLGRVDLHAAALRKLGENAAKYPVDRARGRADKYDEL